MSHTSARELGLCRCHTCGLLVRYQAGSVCPRCHSRLQVRIPHSLAWSWGLLALAFDLHGVRPTLLERDFGFPPLPELLDEVARIRRIQAAAMPGRPR